MNGYHPSPFLNSNPTSNFDFLQAVAVRTPNVYFGAVFQIVRTSGWFRPRVCLDQGFEQLLSLPSSQ